ncbi:MAG: hypothetical protein IJH64_06885 [Oscillospiraceae bacterium]|nr:hypothetical protein [Erysipelotrichaceae bacterium]MBQ4457459.1 hypothetical protein [Clostridia bacterium]MBR0341956.1 hypothetical protein [Oscillospiraceae bacterium]
MKKKSVLQTVLSALIIPSATFVVCELISFFIKGKHLIATPFDLYSLMTGFALTTISAYALSINMSTGRMDFSLGGQQLVGCIIGGNLAISLNLGAFGVVFLSVLFAMLAGLLTGILFVTLRIDAFVLGLGMALILEGVSVAYDINGLEIFDSTITGPLSNRNFILLVSIIVIILINLLMNYTKFGYHYKAIRGSQKLATNAGINVVANCLICYAVCGALTGLVGALNAGINGKFAAQVGLKSISGIFLGFLPILLANYLSVFVPMEIGIPIGALTCRLIQILFGKMNVSLNNSTIYLMLVVFGIVSILNIIHGYSVKKQYRDRALEE